MGQAADGRDVHKHIVLYVLWEYHSDFELAERDGNVEQLLHFSVAFCEREWLDGIFHDGFFGAGE